MNGEIGMDGWMDGWVNGQLDGFNITYWENPQEPAAQPMC